MSVKLVQPVDGSAAYLEDEKGRKLSFPTPASGAAFVEGVNTEEITLSTVGLTTDSVADLLPANSIILAVTARVTVAITATTNWALGDGTTAARFAAANATLAAGTRLSVSSIASPPLSTRPAQSSPPRRSCGSPARHFDGDAEWSVNEKVALETAIGASYAGKRAICSMKYVGVNVASDPLMTAAYLGIKGGLVLAVADDPGAYSSQNEQDSRYYAKFAKIPCLEPSDSPEAKDMTIMAFELSEKTGFPVMLRTVTRISHAYSPVEIGEIRNQNSLSLQKDPANMIAVPSNVLKCHINLNAKQEGLRQWGEDSGLNRTFKNGQKKGIITCGIGYVYAKAVRP